MTSPPPEPPAIAIDSLVVRYPGADGRTAVDGLDLRVPQGAFYGLLGPNGAGKSTTIAALAGLLRPTAGTVRVAGLDPAIDGERVRALIGLVPQTLALHATLGVRENLAIIGGAMGLGGARLRERIGWALAAARLEGREASRVGTLSGGMQRRLNMVASLLHDPRVVVCDEPTTGVDPQSRNHLFEMLRALHAEGRTILYTTHYMEEVEALCAAVAIVDRGRLVAEGPLATLLAGDGSTRALRVVLGGADGDRPSDVDAIGRALAAAGLEVAEVQPERRSLEDLFLALTGRALRDGGEDPNDTTRRA